MTNPKTFGEIQLPRLFEAAEPVKVETILNKEIEVLDMVLLTSKLGDFAVFLFTQGKSETEYSVSCGGFKVVGKLKRAKEEGWFPMKGKLVKEGRTYDLI